MRDEAPRTRWTVRTSLALAGALVATVAFATPRAVHVTHAARTGSLPKGVTISPDGALLFVTNYGNGDIDNVSVFDSATLHVQYRLSLPGIAVESAISPDGRTLYVSNFSRDAVQFVDLPTRRIVREVHVGRHPKIVVVSRDGERLFAANWTGNTVVELDPRTGRIAHTVHTGLNPRGMAITREGRLYVANFNGHSIDVYDGVSLERHHRLHDVCHIPRHLVLSPDDRWLYISCFSASQLAVMDTATETIDRRIPVGTWPKAVDVSADGRYVYTANYGDSSVSVVDTADATVATLDIPSMDHASGIAAARSGAGFYVTGWYDGHLFALDDATAGPPLAFSTTIRTITLQRREFHRSHPVE